MTISTQLFEGKLIRLGPIDHDKDPDVISKWTHDPEYLRMLSLEPARPLSPAQVKKKLEKIEKAVEEEKNTFYFTIRRQSVESEENDRLVGFARFYWIEWNHGVGRLQLGIGDPRDRGLGYGTETLSMLLRYGFEELNLFAVRASIQEYNSIAMKLFTQFGFIEEARQREAILRDGRRWDLLHVGILRNEWEART